MGGSPHLDDPKVKFAQLPDAPVKHFPVPRTAGIVRSTKLSFDDYHMTWQAIATSKPKESVENQCKSCSGNRKKKQAREALCVHVCMLVCVCVCVCTSALACVCACMYVCVSLCEEVKAMHVHNMLDISCVIAFV